MRIAYIASGAAGMYCGTCLHDNTLAAALLALGEDVLLLPAYTPLRTDEVDVSQPRLFFGGVNVYLQQKLPLFRYTPAFFDALLDAPRLIRWLTRRAPVVDPARLGPLTVSMLRGSRGYQRKEMSRLLDWLGQEVRPDVVHLNNALLLAIAPEVESKLGVPVVCSLSGEDVFLERVVEPYYSEARALMKEHAAAVAAFVALNRYYADYMLEYLALVPERVHVIRHGLNLQGHGRRQRGTNGDPLRIGYFARICPDKGLHQLAEAFELLCADPTLPPLRLEAAGYLAAADRPYLDEIEARLKAKGLDGRFRYHGELDRSAKIAFLQSLDVLSAPTVYRESKGISVLEAMANYVPVVLPAHGAFPELIDDTQAGLLFDPGDIEALAAALERLLRDSALADELGRNGGEAVRARYYAAGMAEQTRKLYQGLCAQRSAPGRAQPAEVVR